MTLSDTYNLCFMPTAVCLMAQGMKETSWNRYLMPNAMNINKTKIQYSVPPSVGCEDKSTVSTHRTPKTRCPLTAYFLAT